ncbi:hypothetical protein [Clostridium sp.]|uniref:hypothetical protein n=1 Tax=Clostridium sp. TaxID=1506 RepID=UPI003F4CA0D8
MKRPSIFSKDYEKQIRKRRKKIFLLIIVPIIGLTLFLITDFDSMLDKGISMKKNLNNIFLNKSKQDTDIEKSEPPYVKKEEVVVKPKPKPQPEAEESKDSQVDVVIENETFPVTLSDGQEINVEYKLLGEEKNIEGVSNPKDISYDISPNKKSIVIQSKINQDILYFDANKISKDITKKIHTSSRGEKFYKQDKIKEKPNYIWSIMPKFIDEDNIVYVSELPWMNEEAAQYIWKVNLKNNIHTQVKPAKGKNITFKDITSIGLETIIDGKLVYITSTGKVIK